MRPYAVTPDVVRHYDGAARNIIDGFLKNSGYRYDPDLDAITYVNPEFWNTAQKYEAKTWHQHATINGDDHNLIWAEHFNNYRFLSGRHFANVIEVGCGPFTNWRIIKEHITWNHVTLLDPLMYQYRKTPTRIANEFSNQENVNLVDSSLEGMDTSAKYDLIICINVLPHCNDLMKCLSNIKTISADNAVVVFGDWCWGDVSTAMNFHCDSGHPLKFSHRLYTRYLPAEYNMIYSKTERYVPDKEDICDLSSLEVFVGENHP